MSKFADLTIQTFRVVIEQLLKAATIRKTTHEGVRRMEEAIAVAHAQAPIDFEDARDRSDELALTGRTAWSYGFTNVTIEREADALF